MELLPITIMAGRAGYYNSSIAIDRVSDFADFFRHFSTSKTELYYRGNYEMGCLELLTFDSPTQYESLACYSFPFSFIIEVINSNSIIPFDDIPTVCSGYTAAISLKERAGFLI